MTSVFARAAEVEPELEESTAPPPPPPAEVQTQAPAAGIHVKDPDLVIARQLRPRFNAQKYDSMLEQGRKLVAEGHPDDGRHVFRQLTFLRPRAYEPYIELARIQKAKGDLRGAIAYYGWAKRNEPKDKAGAADFAMAELAQKLGDRELAMRHFEWAGKKAFNPNTSYLRLGLYEYGSRDFVAAENYFHEAEQYFGKLDGTPLMEQQLRTYLGDCYLRTGYPYYATYEHNQAAEGPDAGLRYFSNRSEDFVDRDVVQITLGSWGRYDTNVIIFPYPLWDPAGVSGQPSAALVGYLGVHGESRPSWRWRVGGDYAGTYTRNSNGVVRTFDTWGNSLDAWVSWWNLKTHEVKLRYDYAAALTPNAALKKFGELHGPTLSWAYFPNRRVRLDVAYAVRLVNVGADQPPTPADQRGGLEHNVSLKVSKWAPHWFQPYLKYAFDDYAADGVNFASLTHWFETGSAFRLSTFGQLDLSAAYGVVSFPSSLKERSDGLFQGHVLLTVPIWKALRTEIEMTFTDDSSSERQPFSYHRFEGNAGLKYVFTL